MPISAWFDPQPPPLCMCIGMVLLAPQLVRIIGSPLAVIWQQEPRCVGFKIIQ